ncbi:putative diacylglycerol O-acyltransferase 2-like protein DGAT2L7P [Balaenoptera musculus]|uniref:Diacylglycerol O-acyltransferase 2-like protein DGAT2L7P n=1 Tax=Balaenoptera musculus TaxID=9771 RepID=A0A8B8VCR1_BALMU|nr:putative diacylglycerol O-acyltransferase 2-like protein DGAT2L7P [Balaenoptera musculus]
MGSIPDPDPSWNYLFGFHPHGVLVSGACSNFCTEATGFSHLFPHLQPHLLTLPCWFQLPVFWDYIMCAGSVSWDKASASYLLSRPRGASWEWEGPLEAGEAKPGALSFRIRNQKRFVKLALEEGSAAGEERSAPRAGSGVSCPPAPPGPPWLPSATAPALNSVPVNRGEREVGAPMPAQRTPRPSRAQVDAQHEVYLERLKQLLKEHKARSGVPADGLLPPPRRAAGPHRCPR